MASLLFTDFRGWHTNDFKDVTLTRVALDTSHSRARAFVFFGHVNMDFDGSPTAYGPAKLDPDDDISNAGDDTNGWYGVASASPANPLVKSGVIKIDTDAQGRKTDGEIKFPVVQQAKNGDPKPGYYVSSTPPRGSKQWFRANWYRQNTYIDSSKVAFGALDRFLERDHGLSPGDFGLAIRHDEHAQCGFYFGDYGGWNHALGECSHKVGAELGVAKFKDKFGKTRWDNNFPVSFIVFPRSGGGPMYDWRGPLGDDAIRKSLKPLLLEVSQTENANDLALLMALNESGPAGVAKGKAGLDAFRRLKGAKPRNYGTVKSALGLYGFETWAHEVAKPTLIF